MEASQVKKILEAALLAAREPLTLLELSRMFDEELSGETLRKLLDELREKMPDSVTMTSMRGRPSCSRSLRAGVFGRAPSICLTSNA